MITDDPIEIIKRAVDVLTDQRTDMTRLPDTKEEVADALHGIGAHDIALEVHDLPEFRLAGCTDGSFTVEHDSVVIWREGARQPTEDERNEVAE